MKLADVRFDKYLGTETAKNYSSELHLVDSSRGVDRDNVKISMNNPLRFAGETFYQQHYFNDQEGREGTVLQVVTNTGWMIPYVACMLVGTGLLAQFSITLTRFLRRRDEAQVVAVRESLGRRTAAGFSPRRAERRVAPEARFVWAFPSLVVLAAACFVAYVAREPHAPSDEMRLEEFGRLPVVYEGRVKPLDTVARNVLRIVSDKQTFIDDTGETPKRGQPAIKWLLDAIVKPDMAFRHKVFRIVNPALLESLGLKRREGLRYSPNEFWDQVGQLERQAAVASETDPHKLSVDQKQVVELVKNLRLFIAMNLAFKVQPIRMEKEHFEADWRDALDHLEMLSQMQRHGQGPPLAIPPDSSDAKWEAFSASVIKNIQAEAIGKEPNPATVSMATMLFAYRKGDAKLFNATLAEYETWLAAHSPSDLDESKVQYEAFFNYFAPFWWAAWLYLTAFVLVALGWLGWTVPLNRAALWLVLFTLALHTFAIISRIYISGRPPVTNLYSSAIFIGWGGVVLGIVLEMVYRLGIGTVIASVAGFVTLLIAYFLSASGDTMTVLLAVLDTQFWLATHVVCVTLGYATTYIAGLLGVLYILRGVLTPSLSPAVGKDMARMIYGTLCFAMFFSFVGTVLGGLWADDSWGRFWGWDPKENGALMIVLWNALVLHARWGGMVRERGLANLAIVGNIVVSWSYFGVNELGVGLHSYGFTEGVLLTLGLFTASQLGTIALGLIPRRLWWSSRAQPA
jgi:ABC-type transport system involved in cytochrome c biogenesis permease subunit